MSVYPQFLQHIQDQGLYVDGYNYEEMYNIMINNMMNDFIPSTCFIYSYEQMNELYDYLDELLHSEVESNQIGTNMNNMNNMNQMNSDTETDTDSIYSDDAQNDQIQNDQIQNVEWTGQQLLNAYLANLNQQNINYTNIYYDNTTNYPNLNSNLSNIYTYLNNTNLNINNSN